MVLVFVLGYTAIALEHPLKIDKAASALLTGVITWTLFILGSEDIIHFSTLPQTYLEHLKELGLDSIIADPHKAIHHYVGEYEILHHLGEIGSILFFLLGAMTIVEIVDRHEGFRAITDKIKTLKKVKLLWIISFITFFMSAVLDNLTTTIVMVALLRKLIGNQKDRWFFASMVILAANAGGAWSPIGDVTTIMLWIKGQVTTVPIITSLFIPSLISMVVPLMILSFTMKGNIQRPEIQEDNENNIHSNGQRNFMLILGVSALLFVPVFKTVTHLPPFMGMLLGLGVMWVITEIIHKRKEDNGHKKLTVQSILTKVDVPTVLFFLGILLAVSSLQSAGHLRLLATYLDEHLGNIYLINLAIGILSSIVDNVPLVAGAQGMYPLIMDAAASGYNHFFIVDGQFWQLLAYCAGTGGSILIIGSAAGVAAMGLEKIDFIWYLKRISLLALVGYLSGVAVYYLMFAL